MRRDCYVGMWEEMKGYRISHRSLQGIILNYPYGFAIPVFRTELELNQSAEIGRDGKLPHLKV